MLRPEIQFHPLENAASGVKFLWLDLAWEHLEPRTGAQRSLKTSSQLWSEGLRVWFPKGSDDPEIAVLAIEVAIGQIRPLSSPMPLPTRRRG